MSGPSLSKTIPDGEASFSAAASWMQEHGGEVESRLTLTQRDGVRGIVARRAIGEGSVLIHCPWELIIGHQGTMQSDDLCKVVVTLEREMSLGAESFWYPYLRLNDPSLTRLPTLWDAHTLSELQGLPPYDATRHTDWFSVECREGKPVSGIALQALMTLVTRANRRGMIPVYDLLNHHNGELNTRVETRESGFRIVADRPIPAGGQIFTTYGTRSTPNLFRDYGFIEQWPQTWFWIDRFQQTHTFVRFPGEAIAIEPTESFTSEFGHHCLPLESYQQRAREHTGMISPDSLKKFQSAAEILLKELPTSADEDEKILKTFGELTINGEAARTKLSDLIACVEYRREFKIAVQSAMTAAENTLTKI